MSFTQDELQSLNTILEQKLAAHRRELELSLDQRMNTLRQEFGQCLSALQQNLLRDLPLRLSDQRNEANEVGNQHLEMYRTRFIEEVDQGDAEIAEIQAEISWDDLMVVIDKVVNDRLSLLEGSIQSMVRNIERSLMTQICNLRNDLMQTRQRCPETMTTEITDIRDVFTSIEQLEHLVESLQVAMTANHTLLSNRLYHHQHLPLERAHSPILPDVQSGEEQP